MLATGSRLGPYEILAPLGAGGMGEVYRALDPRLSREVAIKVLPERLREHAEALARFEREARSVAALSHTNILAVHDIGRHEGVAFTVMELLDGETLRDRLRAGALPLHKALDIAIQIARGLGAAHGRGVVHRDLKPENVFVTRDGQVKILDFGLARIDEPGESSPASADSSSPTRISPTTPGVLLGTLGYMAPEQVRGEPADARADLFAFGAVLLEMLTGARAFDGGSPAEAMSAILRDEPFIPRDIGAPPALIRLIRHCLEKRRDERAQSARDVLFVLESIDDLDRPAGVSGASSLSRAPAPSPAAASAASSPPTYRALTFRRGVVHNARFTPDGRMIVYSASWDGLARQMYLARLDGPESTALALPSADLMAVSSAGELLISLERRFIGNVYFSTGRLARAPMMGGAARELLDDVHEADWAPDGERLAVLRRVGSHMRLEYPIDTVRHTTDSWLAFIRVSPDGERVAFFEVWTSGMKTLRVLEPDGSTRVLAELRHWPGGLVWTPDGGELWFMEWGGPDGSMLRAIDLRGRLRTVSQMMGGYTVLHDLAADGSLLWTQAPLHGQISCLAPGEERERDLSWFDLSVAKDLSSDGRTLLFDEQGHGGGPRHQIFLRRTNGSPPIRLGNGLSRGLSPDGRWVLSAIDDHFELLPTRQGQPRTLDVTPYRPGVASWFPDGERIAFIGLEDGREARFFELTIASGAVRPLTPEAEAAQYSAAMSPISQDGTRIAVRGAGGALNLYDVATGARLASHEVDPGDEVIRWISGDRTLLLWRRGEIPLRPHRLDVATGRRELWKEISPPDPTGAAATRSLLVTPAAHAYAYSFSRLLSTLYLVHGLA